MFVPGNNLEQKENHLTKYRDATSRRYLKAIRHRYEDDEERKQANDLYEEKL